MPLVCKWQMHLDSFLYAVKMQSSGIISKELNLNLRSLQLVSVVLRPDQHPGEAAEHAHELGLGNGLPDEVRPSVSIRP